MPFGFSPEFPCRRETQGIFIYTYLTKKHGPEAMRFAGRVNLLMNLLNQLFVTTLKLSKSFRPDLYEPADMFHSESRFTLSASAPMNTIHGKDTSCYVKYIGIVSDENRFRSCGSKSGADFLHSERMFL